MVARSLAGSAAFTSGTRTVPMQAIAPTRTGKSANPTEPKSSEWTRHSSLNIATKRSGMGGAPADQREEDPGQVAARLAELVGGARVEQAAPVEDRVSRADLLRHLEDVGREEDRVPLPDVVDQELLDLVLDDRVEVDEGLVDQGERGT